MEQHVIVDKSDLLFEAMMAEQAERYDEMVEAMKQVVHLGEELSTEERNLLSVAYKNVVGQRRASWRILQSIQQKEIHKGNDQKALVVQAYSKKIETELKTICDDIISLVDGYLLDPLVKSKSQLFYYKMKGDYYRYLREVFPDKSEYAEKSSQSYSDSVAILEEFYPPTDPIRLSHALSMSTFYYEILNDPARACQLAKLAFDAAIGELDSLDEENYKDSTLLMQLLRDNLTLWTSSGEGGQGEDV